MSLIADSEFAEIRKALEITLTHRCTLAALATAGVEGEDGHTGTIPGGAATYDVPCRYETVQRAVRDETGVALVSVPTLTLPAAQAVDVGDHISDVADQLGTVLEAGPMRVERVLDDTAGLGAALLPVYELRAARTVR